MYTRVKTQKEIDSMRTSGAMLAKVLDHVSTLVAPGVSTLELADAAKKELSSLGGKPAFLGYPGAFSPFPHVLCTSVNEQIVHGVPSSTAVLKEGDIISMDFGVEYQGMITDSALSLVVGESTDRVKTLVSDTQQSMQAGIDVLRDGIKTGDVGHAVESFINKRYGIVRDMVGHGVGHNLHEDPNIPNTGRKGSGHKLEAGMTIAIEPMITLGSHKVIFEDDGWTISTADGSLSAHFEHTVLITEDGFEILTLRASE